jgi:HSP20 family protein
MKRSGMNRLGELGFFAAADAADAPPLDVYETNDALVVEADLPGVEPEDVSIGVYDDAIVLEGLKRAAPAGPDNAAERPGGRYHCMERSFGHFKRVVKLPVRVDTSSGKASYCDGVIRLTFPKLKDKVIRINLQKE